MDFKRDVTGRDKTYPAQITDVSRNTSGRNLKLSVGAGEETNNTVMQTYNEYHIKGRIVVTKYLCRKCPRCNG
jgi:hypothetical protein